MKKELFGGVSLAAADELFVYALSHFHEEQAQLTQLCGDNPAIWQAFVAGIILPNYRQEFPDREIDTRGIATRLAEYFLNYCGS